MRHFYYESHSHWRSAFFDGLSRWFSRMLAEQFDPYRGIMRSLVHTNGTSRGIARLFFSYPIWQIVHCRCFVPFARVREITYKISVPCSILCNLKFLEAWCYIVFETSQSNLSHRSLKKWFANLPLIASFLVLINIISLIASCRLELKMNCMWLHIACVYYNSFGERHFFGAGKMRDEQKEGRQREERVKRKMGEHDAS